MVPITWGVCIFGGVRSGCRVYDVCVMVMDVFRRRAHAKEGKREPGSCQTGSGLKQEWCWTPGCQEPRKCRRRRGRIDMSLLGKALLGACFNSSHSPKLEPTRRQCSDESRRCFTTRQSNAYHTAFIFRQNSEHRTHRLTLCS